MKFSHLIETETKTETETETVFYLQHMCVQSYYYQLLHQYHKILHQSQYFVVLMK